MTKISNRKVDKSYEVYFALYQSVSGTEEDKNNFKDFSPDFFDLVVVDECHRGSAAEDAAWREILEYFTSATQIGLTATPKETKFISNIDYFRKPIYTYSLKQGIMAHNYTSLYYHLIFSTKKREPWLRREYRDQVWAYMGGIARKNKMSALMIGGMPDHAHVLLRAKPTFSVSRILQLIKGGSSLWIHETFPKLKQFAWQDGYGAFSVSKSKIPSLIKYIQNQEEHHKRKTFQDEFLELLKLHDIEYDERYIWD